MQAERAGAVSLQQVRDRFLSEFSTVFEVEFEKDQLLFERTEPCYVK